MNLTIVFVTLLYLPNRSNTSTHSYKYCSRTKMDDNTNRNWSYCKNGVIVSTKRYCLGVSR